MAKTSFQLLDRGLKAEIINPKGAVLYQLWMHYVQGAGVKQEHNRPHVHVKPKFAQDEMVLFISRSEDGEAALYRPGELYKYADRKLQSYANDIAQWWNDVNYLESHMAV